MTEPKEAMDSKQEFLSSVSQGMTSVPASSIVDLPSKSVSTLTAQTLETSNEPPQGLQTEVKKQIDV